MISAREISEPALTKKLLEYEKLGGVIDFRIFKIDGAETLMQAHLLTAEKTVLVSLPATDGVQTSPEAFFGPYFDFARQRPVLLGQMPKWDKNGLGFYSDYYYYDDNEAVAEPVQITPEHYNEFVTQAYADAFLNPPYRFGGNMTNFEIGSFFLDFNQLIFGDITRVSVYSWPTDCSDYFIDGKEWWGSFFWTVYNPSSDWFVGIRVSATD